MMAELPVIAVASGGVRELLGGSGILVETGHIEAMAEAAHLLLSSVDARCTITRAQAKRAENFSNEKFVKRLRDLLVKMQRTAGDQSRGL
jgi:glycosyltransferase involved in cell wall biosynthesis